MGGKGADDFNRFVELACNAYIILRRHANVFINLFAMMLSTGIPGLYFDIYLLYSILFHTIHIYIY